MSLLDSVRWSPLIEGILDAVSDEDREVALGYARDESIHQMFRAGVGLAVLISRYSPYRLSMDLRTHGTLNPGEADRLAKWMVDTAPALVLLTLGEVAERPTVEPAPGVLWVDPALPDLPLLPLAVDWATRAGGLRVIAEELPPGIGGVYGDGVIRLDPGNHDPAQYFPHELAHALDPHRGKRGNPVYDEQYADLLARLLMQHQPWSVEEATPHIVAAATEVTDVVVAAAERPDPDLPAAGPDSVVTFVLLPNRK